MKIRGVSALVFLLGLILVTSPAFGKGPSKVTVEGQGLEAPIRFGGGEGSSEVGAFAQASGIYQGMYGDNPGWSPMLEGRPSDDLGPRYVATYAVPQGNGRRDLIRQFLYPYAKKGPVTHTPSGQPFFKTQETLGGWFRAPVELKDRLVEAGLSRSFSSSSGSESDLEPAPSGTVGLGSVAIGIVVVLLVGVSVLVAARRRRPQAAGSN